MGVIDPVTKKRKEASEEKKEEEVKDEPSFTNDTRSREALASPGGEECDLRGCLDLPRDELLDFLSLYRSPEGDRGNEPGGGSEGDPGAEDGG